MSVSQFINEVVFKIANDALDIVFLLGGLILIFSYPVYFYVHNLNKYTKERKGRTLLSETITLFIVVAIAGVIWVIPETSWLIVSLTLRIPFTLFSQWQNWAWIFSSIRWAEALGFFFLVVWHFGREHGKTRWRESAVLHIVVIIFGWIFNRWLGIIFISLPLLWAYHSSLHDLALIIMPASNPDDLAEQKKRRNAFLSYTWGIQSPITVVDGHSWKKYEPRISGDITWDFSDFPIPIIKNLDWRPGLIWTHSHQVAAITGGTKFKRIDGPGLVFTGKLERLDQIFDLRLQLRTKEIEVVSKDGIHFLARFFIPFRIDNEEWKPELYDTLRPKNAILRGADKLTHNKGSFRFSTARVQATLGVTSTKATSGGPLVYWDQWAMNIVEDQTRQVISQKNLDEMWRPANDTKFANAMDSIATEIKANCEPILRSAGILLYAARVVNFRFIPKEGAKPGELDEISEQQIATWKSEWDRKRDGVLSEAQSESDRTQQEARAYAEAALLNAIAEGLEKANEMNPRLPHYVIAMRFLSALQDFVHKQPVEGEGGEEVMKKMTELKNEFKTWQEQFFPGEK